MGAGGLLLRQERFWTGRELEARTVASTIPVMALFRGPLDLDGLRRAMQEVVDRHGTDDQKRFATGHHRAGSR